MFTPESISSTILISLDKYRTEARKTAWYDGEGEPSSHNPFKKFRPTRNRRSNTLQLERGVNRSLGDLSEDHRRRQEMNHGLEGPAASSSFPAELPPNGQASPTTLRSQTEHSMASHNALTNNSSWKGKFSRKFSSGDGAAEDKKSLSEPQNFTLASQLKATILNSWINVLLIAAPVGIALYAVDANPIAVFVVNFIAIIPLAAMLSFATEEIALRTGETIGGLLNASFGNAVELIVAIIALVQRKTLIVQTSLIGSILSNLLLVLGMCFFLGGVDRMEQNFNVTVAQTAASMLALAVSSLIIPTAYHKWSNLTDGDGTAPLSRGTSVLLLIVYGCYLFFQLKSHAEMYNRPSEKVERRHARVNEGDASRGIAQIGKMSATPLVGQSDDHMQMEEEDDAEEPQLSILTAVLTLIISTAFVAACAEFMVSSIDALTATGNIRETFVGLILLPIVGNAAEHATAVTVACKDKMDLAIGVAVGSSMQIALLVLPLIVVLGWIIGVEDMVCQLASNHFLYYQY